MRLKTHVRQLIDVSLVVVVASAVVSVVVGHIASLLALITAAPFLIYARKVAYLGEVDLAFKVLALTLSLLATAFIWGHDGLSGPAINAYPAILAMFALTSSTTWLIGTACFYIASLTALYALSMVGIYNTTGSVASLDQLLYCLFLIAGCAAIVLSVQLTSYRAVAKLDASNAAVIAREKEIYFLNSHDLLTGLPIRTLAKDRFELMMRTASQRKGSCAILFLNLDNFRHINNHLGHPAGDQFLVHIAQQLRTIAGPENSVCRQTGDEFLILLDKADSNETITGLINAVMEELKAPVTIHGTDVSCSCSIGVAVYPADGRTFDEIANNADAAMAMAKGAGRNAFMFFDQKANTREKKSFHMITNLRKAITGGELVLHYQPQFDLATGRIIGAEALVRWQHPTEGLLSPGSFIHLAEKSGLIDDLGNWVLFEACGQAANWYRQGHSIVVSINTSPIQFMRRDMASTIASALKQSGLPAKLLDIELTESLFVEDTQETSENLLRIRQLGVNLSIDDFGTGYSCIGYLPRLPVQTMKIDQSFIRDMTPDKLKIVRSMIQLAGNFNLETIAEGVEDASTMSKLLELGCTRGQGYHWDRPLSVGAFEAKYMAPVPQPLACH